MIHMKNHPDSSLFAMVPRRRWRGNPLASLLRLVLAGIWLALPAIPSLAREVEPLESNWHFHLGETAAAESNTLDDSSWETVSLPHNWGWQEAEQGKDYYRGPGWYRRALAQLPGQRWAGSFITQACRANAPAGECATHN